MRSIYGQYERPPIGERPAYVKAIVDTIPDLTKIDSLVLKLSCEEAIKTGYRHITTKSILDQAKSLDISEEELLDTLDILHEKGYIEGKYASGRRSPSFFLITVCGFEEYARAYIGDYDSIVESVVSQIVNHNKTDNRTISQALGQPKMIVNHILEVLENNGVIKVARRAANGLLIRINRVSPELRRMLR